MLKSLRILIVVCCCANILFAHGGGLDRNGGHMDSRTGTYHFHGAPSIPSFSGPSSSGFMDNDPTGERRAARTEARKKAKERAEALKSQRSKPSRGDTIYLFHDVEIGPYQVTSFEDNDKNWKCLLASGYRVNLAKERIIRIEASANPQDFRTWFDRSGKFSLVARHIDHDKETVTLEKLDERQIVVQISRLSDVDIEHLKKIDNPLGEMVGSSSP